FRSKVQNPPLAPRIPQLEVPRQVDDHGSRLGRPELHESSELIGRAGVLLRAHASLLESPTRQLHQAIIAFNPFLKKAERQSAGLSLKVHYCSIMSPDFCPALSRGRPCCGRAWTR